MGKILRFLIILFPVLCGSASTKSEIVIQTNNQFVNGAVWIDPIFSDVGQLWGFVLADSTAKTISIIDLAGETIKVCSTDFQPYRTIHRYSSERDTLVIYSLVNTRYGDPGVSMLAITDDTVISRQLVQLRVYDGACFLGQLWNCDISFKEDSAGDTVVRAAITAVASCYDFTIGSSWDTKYKVFDYTLDLDTVAFEYYSGQLEGDMTSDAGVESCVFQRHSWGYNYNDPDQYSFATMISRISVIAEDAESICSSATMDAHIYDIFAGKFSDIYPYDDIIVYGYGKGFFGFDHNSRVFAACYDFSTAVPVELWYKAFDDIFLKFHSHSQRAIYGLKRCDSLAVLDGRTGIFYPRQPLGRCLSATRFFEDTDSTVYLVGRNADTLFVYRFQEPTDAPGDPIGNLPTEYALFQNFPNPFNSSTKIRFSLPASAKVSVEIYNILGVRVRKLVDKRLAGGQHTVVWDGHDENGNQLANGVYFCRLKAGKFAAARKMLLLK